VCSSSTSCMSIGQFWPEPTGAPHPGLSFAERWDGLTWTVQPTMNPPGTDEAPLNALSCAAPADCTAIGFYVDLRSLTFRPLVEHWNGGPGTIQPTSMPPGGNFMTLLGVSCVTGAVCTAVGNVNREDAVDRVSSVPLVLHASD
jgi:hypothetical protein